MRRIMLLTVAVGLLTASAGLADVLVTRDGAKVTTKGPWEVRGAIVVFHLPNGTLSSMRVDQVDLEASKTATAAALAPKPAPAEAKPAAKAPVAVLTDEDVTHVDPDALPAWQTGAEEGESEGEAEPAEEEAPPAGARLQVSDWQEEEGASGGVSIIGTVVNNSADVTGNVEIVVELVDAEGKLIATADAVPSARSLLPGQRTTFRARFPGVFNYDQVRFETEHLALRTETIGEEGEFEEEADGAFSEPTADEAADEAGAAAGEDAETPPLV